MQPKETKRTGDTVLITSKADVNIALEFIQNESTLAIDAESTGLNVRKDTVIGFGFGTISRCFYFPRFEFILGSGLCRYPGLDDSMARELLIALASKKLIAFNTSFDGRILESNFEIDIVPSVICDVLLLKHTCDEEFPFGLKEIATKVLNFNASGQKETLMAAIKTNGGAKNEYYKAPVQILADYCSLHADSDIALTWRLYNYYSASLKKQKLEKFFYEDEVMPLYKEVTIPMERRGVRMNIAAMNQALVDITQDLVQLEASIQETIAPLLPTVFLPWRMNLDYPVQTGTGRRPKWYDKAKLWSPDWTDLQLQIAQHATDTNGAYVFNLQSKFDLKKLFFDTLKCTPLATTPTGLPKADEEFLESITGVYPWVADLIVYNKLNKLKSTYIERFLNECEDGIFYPSWLQHRTVSGRYGGDLQQLPRSLESGHPLIVRYTNAIRTFIIPRTNNLLLSADYNQLEPTVFAHTSGDPALHRIFKEGLDFYSEVIIETEGLTQYSSVKTAANYLGKLNKALRQNRKPYPLGLPYGMTPYKLQFELGVSIEEAEQIYKRYFQRFSVLAKWMHKSQDQVRMSGFMRTESGRIRHLPRAKILHGRYGTSLSDSLHLWKQYHANPAVYAQAKADRKTYINELNNGINVQVQGLAASIVNRAAIACARAGYLPIANIHDELLFDLPEADITAAAKVIQNIMETTTALTVPLFAPPQIGSDYSKCK